MLPLLFAILAASPADAPTEQQVALVVATAEQPDRDAPSASRLRNRRFPIELGAGVSLHGREKDAPYAGLHLRAVATLPFGMTLAAEAAFLPTFFSQSFMAGGSLGYAFTPGEWLIRPYVGGGYSKTQENTLFGGVYEIRDAGHVTVGIECLTPSRIFGFGVEGGGLKTYAGRYFNTWDWRGFATGVMTWYFV